MTVAPFFRLSMLAPDRQRSFRIAAVLHLTFFATLTFAVLRDGRLLTVTAQALLTAGIVEGAILVGWRLTQIPKSQALEFLLVSPVQPKSVFHAEAAVGFGRLALLAVSGIPLLGVLVLAGRMRLDDLLVLVVMPFTWAAITGLGVTVWAYESRAVRRGLEMAGLIGVLIYLIVGVLAGEKLPLWLGELPESTRWWTMEAIGWLHTGNPFAVLQFWFMGDRPAELAAGRMIGLEMSALGIVGLLALRGAARLRGHFHDRHYRPLAEAIQTDSRGPGERPLSWWAVRRVLEYSGRVNIWLAGGFGVVYAVYTVAGDRWPPWLGRLIFQMVESAGGIPAVATGLIVLAAVPACFQYGLWDSSVPARCRRLELLLLTELDGRDYWAASAAAAWRRGRGYFATAIVLWIAAGIAGRATVLAVLAAASAAVIMWGLYFALGFWSFARGRQANNLGSVLTIGAPVIAIVLVQIGCPALAALIPPGNVWTPLARGIGTSWLVVALIYGISALVLGRVCQARCDENLRAWLGQNHGRRAMD